VRRDVASRGISIITAMKHLLLSSVDAAAVSVSIQCTNIESDRNVMSVTDVRRTYERLAPFCKTTYTVFHKIGTHSFSFCNFS